MKKIKIAFAALTAVAGIGGAYAATHQGDANRVGTLYNWYTPGGALYLTGATVNQAASQKGCIGGPSVCLRGTITTKGVTSVRTLFKPIQ